ncbi:DUF732 domain-containing protein [uncultured Corynebacterium sp.]|uniref:DUF732 domain-containing protein n=1 Tax=uncultured Corynebacterium sp. TaxID=159447 RepID=UPI002626E955|nr:DUF732 domain-containing protein [uncultured Corynebacterium sp.]
MRKTAMTAVLAAVGLSLAACGGATVDSEDVTATPSTSAAAPSSSVEESQSATETESSSAASAPADDPAAGEGAASEVENTPDAAPMRPDQDEAFLEALREGGVNVEGNEEQLVGTARTICGGSDITRDAVAGQLIEQQATQLEFDDLTKLIDSAARDNLC